MKIPVRLVISMVIAVSLISVASAIWDVRDDVRQMREELAKNDATLAESLEQTTIPLLQRNQLQDLESMAERFGNRERLAGVVIADRQNRVIAATPGLSADLQSVAMARTAAATPRGDFLTG